jgi:hypothetical protein
MGGAFVFRKLGVAAIALVAGFGLGLAKDAGADQPKPATAEVTKTPVSCLLALESAWKTINQTPPGIDHKAEFDAEYAKCLEAS